MKYDDRMIKFIETNLGDIFLPELALVSPKLQAYVMMWELTRLTGSDDFDWLLDQVKKYCQMSYPYETVDKEGNKVTSFMAIDRTHQLNLLHNRANQCD